MTTLALNRTIGDLVAERPGRSAVFDRFGIDHRCGGQVPLSRAIATRGLDPETILRELQDEEDRDSGAGVGDWLPGTPGELADFIVATHHAYLRRELPRLADLLGKVASAHGRRHPVLWELRHVFDALRGELTAHLLKEEWVVFPIIRQLSDGEADASKSRGLSHLIDAMGHEHDGVGAALRRMRALTDGYTPPGDACNAYRALLNGLEELESDLRRHIHRENNLLFPTASARGPSEGGVA